MMNDVEAIDRKSPRRPWQLEFRSSKGFIIATVCTAIFTDTFLYGVVVPVLPFSLRDRSGVPEEDVQWWNSFIFAVFGFSLLIACPICGWISDRTSDRTTSYFVGLFILLGATLLFGLSSAAWILVVSRFLQGVSAAIVWTVGLALVVDTVGSDNIGQWMGTVLACSSLGLITSPLLGGIVYDAAGYFAVFAMAMGLIIFDIVMRLLMISKQSAAKYIAKEPSVPARNCYSTFADEHTYHNSGRNEHGAILVTPGIWTETIPSYESHESAPLLNVHDTINDGKHESTSTTFATFTLLSSPRFLAAMYGIFVNISILAAFDGVLPLVVEDLFNWNSLASGLIFLCLASPSLLGPFVGSLSDRYGPRWFAVAGCVLTAIPLILLRLIEFDNTNQKVELCGLLTFCGCTLVLIVSPVASDLSHVVEAKEEEQPGIFGQAGAYGQAFALFNMSQAAATLFGPTVAGALRDQYGWKVTSLAMGIFALSGAIPSLFFTGGWLFQKKTA